MKPLRIFPALLLCAVSVTAQSNTAGMVASSASPREWIDPATGHRVVQLTTEPGSESLYFHQNAYTRSGDKMVIGTPEGLSVVQFKTRSVEPLVTGSVKGVVVGRDSRLVYYLKSNTVCATDIDSGKTREIVRLPDEMLGGSGLTVNADDTLLAGSYVEGGDHFVLPEHPDHGFITARWQERPPMRLFTINIQTGVIKTFNRDTNWLNHVQFSPTDPQLILFCHEGPWHLVDRIWTIRTDGSGLRLVHRRTMDGEIAGHEFFSPDGRTVWFDLQTPKSKMFWLAGCDLATGKETRYPLIREEWSVHYNVSPDGKLFAGDGGGPKSVASSHNGQWIYLFRPRDGKLAVEKLVDLSKHDYHLEPNVSFTPDGKWIVFRSNLSGAAQTYAVEIQKAR